MSSGIAFISFAPEPLPDSATFAWTERPRTHESPETGTVQVQRRNNGRWLVEMGWESIEGPDAWPILAQLQRYGQHTAFQVYSPAQPNHTGDATNTQMDGLQVDGAGQTGQALAVKTSPAVNNTLLFRAGDLVGFKDPSGFYQVFRVFQNFTTNGSGTGTIQLCQYIRTSPADSAAVFSRYVPLSVHLAQPIPEPVTPPVIYDLKIQMREAIFG